MTSESDSQVNEMTMLEIVLLLIGIICIAVSFMFSVKLDGPEKTQSTGTKLSDNQKEDIRRQITSVFNEQTARITQTVEDRTRDELERLSNQKIKEFAEYSDTVLGEINKSHNEVMFLYDMLNEKSKEVHNNIRDMQKAADKQKASIGAERGFHAVKDNTDPDKNHMEEAALLYNAEISAAVDVNKAVSVSTDENVQAGGVETGDNKRDNVLKLYKQGKSVIEIAKTLGIGVGEVRLVIDLFKGTK
mgnify:FL=1